MGNTLDLEMQTKNGSKATDAIIRARFKDHIDALEMSGSVMSRKIAESIVIVAKDLVAKDERKVMANIKAGSAVGFWQGQVIATRGGERDIVPALLELGTWKMAPRPFMKPAGRMVIAAHGVGLVVREMNGLIKHEGDF